MRFFSLTAALRHPTTLLTGSFLVVAGAIVANALFLQPRPHPSPLVVTRTPPEAPQTEEPRAASRSDDLVLAVQSGLRRLGYYAGPLDGLAGPQTQAAISRFQADAGLEQTGAASLELLAAVDAAKEEDAASLADLANGEDATGSVEPAAPDAQVAAIQHALAISAYGPLRTDGVLGPETREAILRFQRDRGLPPTGQISDALVLELRSMGAMGD